MRLVHGRLAAVSARASFAAGGWVGFALGVVAGGLVGALISWISGALIEWQRQLALTLGITQTLLPFADQIPALIWIGANWWLVIPASALALGLVSAAVGGLIGALLAAAYNRSPRHASVVVELDDTPSAGPDAAPDSAPSAKPDATPEGQPGSNGR